jgi:hypothetical protein
MGVHGSMYASRRVSTVMRAIRFPSTSRGSRDFNGSVAMGCLPKGFVMLLAIRGSRFRREKRAAAAMRRQYPGRPLHSPGARGSDELEMDSDRGSVKESLERRSRAGGESGARGQSGWVRVARA